MAGRLRPLGSMYLYGRYLGLEGGWLYLLFEAQMCTILVLGAFGGHWFEQEAIYTAILELAPRDSDILGERKIPQNDGFSVTCCMS